MATLSVHQSEPEFVTVEEYLHTVYEPECDYVDGRIALCFCLGATRPGAHSLVGV